jgi:hypothetical protein
MSGPQSIAGTDGILVSVAAPPENAAPGLLRASHAGQPHPLRAVVAVVDRLTLFKVLLI